MKPIKVVYYINHAKGKENACTMYRNYNPMKYIKGVEARFIHEVKSEIEYDPIRREVKNIKIHSEPIEWADIVMFSRHYDNIALMGCIMEIAKQMGKVTGYETDDLLHQVQLNAGEYKIGGSDMHKNLKFVDFALEHCDFMTVSTPFLKEYYAKTFKRPIFVLPNFYDPAYWRGMRMYYQIRKFWRKNIKRDKVFRIGWQGGNNHFLNNFNYLVDPMNALKKKYGDKLQFVVMGGQPNLDLYPKGSATRKKFLDFDFEHHPPVSIKGFPKRLAEMDLDLGLIVVEDNEFSRAKSNIKWMEYALLGIPSVASNCEPYRTGNSILVDNTELEWVKAIEEMMQQPQKCAKMSVEALHLAEEFNIKNHAQEWADVFSWAMGIRVDLPKVGDSLIDRMKL